MFEVVPFVRSEEMDGKWDSFVVEDSINGTFLQTRNFLNYHPTNRFDDCSIFIYETGKGSDIAAVCPACFIEDDGEKTIWSHRGSTFGGLVIAKKYHTAKKILEIISCAEEYWCAQDAKAIYYKQTGDLFTKGNDALFEYCLQHSNYRQSIELSAYIDFQGTEGELLSNFSHGRVADIRICEKNKCEFKKVSEEIEIFRFYEILCENLKKYNTAPVHSLAELRELYQIRLPNAIEFFGVYVEGVLLSGAMMFVFAENCTVHAQYMAASRERKKFSPMTYLYYGLICHYREQKYQKLSWGIATENSGQYLNEPLLYSKESYGSKHALNRTFSKRLSEYEPQK